jgi:HAD superfamily hydrolase (TIGR01509 family)
MGADNLIEHLLGEQPDEETDKRLRTAHSTLYAEYWPRLRRLPGARELVYALAERGHRVVLASSADGDELEMLRGVLGADEAIAAATSASDAARSKPAPDILQAALDMAGLTAAESILIGDSVWDIAAASHLSMPCVALTCGGTSRGELEQAGAVAVFDDPADLLANLDG